MAHRTHGATARAFKALLLGGAAAACMSGAAIAQPADSSSDKVEKVVVTAPRYVPQRTPGATKTDTPLVETPQSVTVIDRDQMDVLGWTSVDQAVRYSAGVIGENFGPDQRYDWLTLRGFYPIQYVDGLQAPIGSTANIGLDLFGLELVEILKGPASGLYGTTPPGGIVNMVSRRPGDVFGGSVSAMYGNNDSWQFTGDVTGPLSDTLDYRLTGLYRDKGTQIDGVNVERTYVAPALTMKFGPATQLTLLSYYQDDDVQGDGGGFLPASGLTKPNPFGQIPWSRNLGEPGYNRFQREQYGVGYDFAHEFSDMLILRQNMKYFSADTDILQVYGAGLQADNRTVNRNNFPFKEEVTSLNFDTRLEGHFDTGGLAHYLLVGFDYRDFENGSKFGFAFWQTTIDLFNPVYGQPIVTPPLSFTFLDQQEQQTGLYVQDQIKAGSWIFTLTGRQDWLDTTNAGVAQDLSEFTYRVGLNYVFDSGFAPYVAYATSFQPTKPGFDFVTSTNVLLDPSTGKQFEAGVKWDGRGLPKGVNVFASAAYYSLTQDNVVSPGPDVRYPFGITQVGEVEVQGLELEAVARFYERLSFNASYSYTDSEIVNSSAPSQIGKPMAMVPDHKASIFADYTWQDGPLAGLGFGFGVRYVSETLGAPGFYDEPNEAVTLADGSIHYDFADWRIQLNGNNLFDKEYVARCNSDSECYLGTKGVYTVTVTKSFGAGS